MPATKLTRTHGRNETQYICIHTRAIFFPGFEPPTCCHLESTVLVLSAQPRRARTKGFCRRGTNLSLHHDYTGTIDNRSPKAMYHTSTNRITDIACVHKNLCLS